MNLKSTTWCIILYLLLSISFVNSQDLFDMFNNVKEHVTGKVDQTSTKVEEKKNGETCPATLTTEYRTVLTAYRSVIKDWIEKFPSKNAKEYRLLAELHPDEFNRLNKFASDSRYEEKDVLHDVHVISDLLRRIVYKIEEDKPVFGQLTWSAWIRSFNINEIIKAILFLIAVGIISFISIRAHLRGGRWFTTFFILAFVVSVIQNWYTLYQEAQAKIDEVLMKQLPKHCRGHSMGIGDHVKAMFGRFFQLPSNDCFEYQKALRAAPHSLVTPMQAVSMTFAQLFVTPLGAIGESLSQFFAGTMRHVPMVLWPITIVLIVIIFIIIILMYSRYEINLPFMMGSIRPSSNASIPHAQNVQPIENSSNHTQNQVQELKDQINDLKLQLQQQQLQIEHGRSNTETTNRSRQRSKSNQRLDDSTSDLEDELRQRPVSSEIGFKKEFFS